MNHNTKLTGMVVYPNDPEYQQARMNWNPFTNTFPIVFVFSQNVEDVDETMFIACSDKLC